MCAIRAEWVTPGDRTLDLLFRWFQQSHSLHETRPGVHGLHQCIVHWRKQISGKAALMLLHQQSWRSGFPQGYRQKDYFIATQGPLPHTVEDFWRMVWEWKCHSIVMLTELQEREQVSSWSRRSLNYNHLPKAALLIWCSGILGQMLPVLARRGLCCLRRLQGRAERRHFVWHFQSTRLGTDVCAGKKIHSALTSSEITMYLCCLYFCLITHIHLQCNVTSFRWCTDFAARLVHVRLTAMRRSINASDSLNHFYCTKRPHVTAENELSSLSLSLDSTLKHQSPIKAASKTHSVSHIYTQHNLPS